MVKATNAWTIFNSNKELDLRRLEKYYRFKLGPAVNYKDDIQVKQDVEDSLSNALINVVSCNRTFDTNNDLHRYLYSAAKQQLFNRRNKLSVEITLSSVCGNEPEDVERFTTKHNLVHDEAQLFDAKDEVSYLFNSKLAAHKHADRNYKEVLNLLLLGYSNDAMKNKLGLTSIVLRKTKSRAINSAKELLT